MKHLLAAYNVPKNLRILLILGYIKIRTMKTYSAALHGTLNP